MAQPSVKTPSEGSAQSVHRRGKPTKLQVTTYDRSSSMLIALLILVGTVVVGILIIYWTLQLTEVTPTFPISEIPAGRGDSAEGLARDPEPPGFEDAPELDMPQLPATLTSLAAASTKSAMLADFSSNTSGEVGKGSGLGDSRAAGRGGNGAPERVPREERWKIKYVDVDIKEYGRQLDFFDVELGVIDRKKNAIHWAKNFSGVPKTGVHTSKETRKRGLLALSFQAGNLRLKDQQLVVKAGITARGQVVQFFPRKFEDQLVFIELEKAGKSRTVNDIYRTYFEVRRKGNGYEIFVADQKYF